MKKSIITNTEEIQQYIKDIRKIPVVSHERQEEIFILLNNKNIDKKLKKEAIPALPIYTPKELMLILEG